jgi:hypothetical protein
MSSKQFVGQEVLKAFLKFPIDTAGKHKYINIIIKYINIKIYEMQYLFLIFSTYYSRVLG